MTFNLQHSTFHRRDGGHGRLAVPLTVFLTLWTVSMAAVPGHAGPAAPLDLHAEVGWSGWIVPGAWLPLRVTLSATDNLEGAMLIEVPEVQSRSVITYQIPVRITAGARQRLTAAIIITDPRQPVRVRIVQDGREVVRREIVLGSTRAVEGVVASLTHDAVGLEFLSTLSRKLRAAYIGEQDLPVRWQTYGGVEWLVIRDLDDRRVLPRQRQALVEWLAQGGRLLVTGGDRLAELRVPWLLDLLPATVRGVGEVRPTGPLSGVSGPVAVALVSPRAGASVSPASGPPMAVQWRWGRGTVVLWTFDAFAPSIRAWPGLEQLWRPLIESPPPVAVAQPELAALLPSTRPLPGSAQAALGVLSILYIIVMRVGLRRLGSLRLGVFAITAVAAVFGTMLYGVAAAARAASSALIQVSVAEAIPASQVARVTTYVSIVSPYGGVFGLRAPAGGAIVPLTRATLTFADTPATVEGTAAPGNLTFEVRQVVPLPVQGRIVPQEDEAEVDIQNRSGMVLRDAALVSHRQVYRLPDIGRQLTLRLNPAKWETVQPRALPIAWEEQVREWVLARLNRQPEDHSGGDRPWLMARIQDPRLAVQDRRGRPGMVLQVLLVPLDAGARVPGP